MLGPASVRAQAGPESNLLFTVLTANVIFVVKGSRRALPAHMKHATGSDRLASSPPQGQAESYLERLHKMVENDLNEFIDGGKVDAWAKWRENLIGLTDVTRSHFDKLVMEL